ncbi:MAG TPA: hypothetical protein VEV81_13480, partial [Pyrinomonadaceae bacterium]|nr:hypothetical protein [Pyrinomonadaceae bacterium]
MITGFNTDVEHDGVVYHVQTEDKGLKSPLLLSLVYVGGTILASKRTPYDDLVATGFDEKVLAERLQRQHKLICAAIRAGRIEDLKKQTERESASRAKAPEQVEGQATPKPPVGLPAEAPAAISGEEFIIEMGNIADFMPPSSFMSPPAEQPVIQKEAEPPSPSPAAPPPPPEIVVPSSPPEVDHVDYSRVVDYTYPAETESDLQI